MRPRLGMDIPLHFCFMLLPKASHMATCRGAGGWGRHPTDSGRAEQERKRGDGLDEDGDQEVEKNR